MINKVFLQRTEIEFPIHFPNHRDKIGAPVIADARYYRIGIMGKNSVVIFEMCPTLQHNTTAQPLNYPRLQKVQD